MTEKKGLLPIVSKEVGFSIQNEVFNSNENEFALNLIRRLANEDNPCIANYLSQLAIQSRTAEMRDAILYAGLGVYRLLESQAEADKMKQELG